MSNATTSTKLMLHAVGGLYDSVAPLAYPLIRFSAGLFLMPHAHRGSSVGSAAAASMARPESSPCTADERGAPYLPHQQPLHGLRAGAQRHADAVQWMLIFVTVLSVNVLGQELGTADLR